jgi:hypothetical protein
MLIRYEKGFSFIYLLIYRSYSYDISISYYVASKYWIIGEYYVIREVKEDIRGLIYGSIPHLLKMTQKHRRNSQDNWHPIQIRT